MRHFQPQRILCPVDFSQQSVAALKVADGIARAFQAEVIVLHAQRFEPPLYFTAAQTQALKTQLRRSLRAARSYLTEFAEEHLSEGLPRSIQVVEADPVVSILQASQEAGTDLVVMGTHGRTGLTKIRLGSVTESVLRQIGKPILTVGPQVQPSPALGRVQRVFCPVDYSDLAGAAFEHAVALAQKLGAQIIVGHVLEDGRAPDQAKQALCDWVPPEVRRQCSVREVVRQGDAAEQILLEVKNSRADLLVIGAAPRNVLGAWWFGSTTEKLIRSSTCPVFSVIGRKKKT